jgi:hypothetical protein
VKANPPSVPTNGREFIETLGGAKWYRSQTTCSISAKGKNPYRGPVGAVPKKKKPI